MKKEEKKEKELIERICAHTEELIRNGEYTDNPQQLIEFAKSRLHAYITSSDLDRLVKKYMRIPNKTRRGRDAEPVPYNDFQDYVDRTRLNIRIEQHHEANSGKINLSDMLSLDKTSRTYNRRR